MQIESIKLYQFRNYRRLQLQPSEGLCVLTGPNAAGKTNILESVFLCALGKSHRTHRDGDLIMQGQLEGMVSLRVKTRLGKSNIRIELVSGERKRVLINDKPLARSGELMGVLNVVLFSPEDLELVKGGPAERRRFMDMELSQLHPSYYYTLQQYNAALKQRNILLKDPMVLKDDTLQSWDSQLAILGASLTKSRQAFCNELEKLSRELHFKMSSGTEELIASYQADLPSCDADVMQQLLADNLEKDIYRGYTSVGPHKDDIALVINGVDVRSFGSQGQQRTAALSLKLSQIDILKRVRHESPVLLLDDVFSELDATRQTELLKVVQGCQAIVTCTHLEELTRAGVDRMQVYCVSQGRVTEA